MIFKYLAGVEPILENESHILKKSTLNQDCSRLHFFTINTLYLIQAFGTAEVTHFFYCFYFPTPSRPFVGRSPIDRIFVGTTYSIIICKVNSVESDSFPRKSQQLHYIYTIYRLVYLTLVPKLMKSTPSVLTMSSAVWHARGSSIIVPMGMFICSRIQMKPRRTYTHCTVFRERERERANTRNSDMKTIQLRHGFYIPWEKL